jgi:hypothetical protein
MDEIRLENTVLKDSSDEEELFDSDEVLNLSISHYFLIMKILENQTGQGSSGY